MNKKKVPKLSYAILKGIEKYPKQCFDIYVTAEKDAACAIGGAMSVYKISPFTMPPSWCEAIDKFEEEYGISVYLANDGYDPEDICNEPISREDIAGMFKAISY